MSQDFHVWVRGRRIVTLRRGPAGPGRVECLWRGRDRRGEACPSGSYLIRASGPDGVQIAKASSLR